MTRTHCLIILVLTLFSWEAVYADIVLDDGLVHEIDREIHEILYIRDDISGMPPYTTLVMSSTAVFHRDLRITDHSYLAMNGGHCIEDLTFTGYANGRISGGQVDGMIIADKNTTVTCTGHPRIHSVLHSGNAQLNIQGGTYQYVESVEFGSISVSGGDFTGPFNLNGQAVTDISGGTFYDTVDLGGTNVSISGGTFESSVFIKGHTEISGGRYANEIVLMYPVSSLQFDGPSFAVNGVPIEDLQADEHFGMAPTDWRGWDALSGIVTGTLADGTELSQSVYLVDTGAPVDGVYGTISFVPEPTSLALVALGGGWVMRRRRRA